MAENREIRSSVFTDLFGDDELVGKKNFLSLYNALHGTDLKLEETKIVRKIIPQTLSKTFYTDVTMEINGKLIVFVEHQSTINKNMPLRFLEYFVHILYGIVPARARYWKALFKIPTPEFYVLYNGTDPLPYESELKLSDAFEIEQKNPLCELKVKVLNIGGKEEVTLPIIQKCDILKQYCEFIATVFEKKASLKPDCTNEEANEALEQAINECIKKDILSDYLIRKSTEVRNMFFGEYSYEEDIAAQREEAREEGIEEGIEQGIEQGIQQGLEQGAQQQAIETAINMLKKKKYSVEEIAEITSLSLEKVLELQQAQLPKQK